MGLDNVSKNEPKKSKAKIEAEKRVKEMMRQRGIKERGEEGRSKEFDFLEGEKPEEEGVPRREEIAPVRATKVKINFNTLYGSLLEGNPRYTLGERNIRVPKLTNYISNKEISDAGVSAFETMVLDLIDENTIPKVHKSKFNTLRKSIRRIYASVDYFFSELVRYINSTENQYRLIIPDVELSMLRILNKIWIKKYKSAGIINFVDKINKRIGGRRPDTRVRIQTEETAEGFEGKRSPTFAVAPKKVTTRKIPKSEAKIVIEFAGRKYDIDNPSDVKLLQEVASSEEGRQKHEALSQEAKEEKAKQEIRIVELMDELKELGEKKRNPSEDMQVSNLADRLSNMGNVKNLNLNDEKHTPGQDIDERIKEIRIELKELNFRSPMIRAYAEGTFSTSRAQERAQELSDILSRTDMAKAVDDLLNELGVESDTIIKEDTGIILEELNKRDKRLIKTLLQLANPTEYFNEDVLKLGELITAMKSLGVVNKNKNLKKQILKYEDENLKVVKRAVRLRREYEKLYKSIREVIYPKSGDEDE